MRSRPFALSLIAISMASIAISFPLQIMALYQHSIWEFQAIFVKISHLNLIVIIFSLMNAYFAWQAHSWLKITLPVSVIFMALNNFTVAQIGDDFTMTQTLTATFGYCLLVILSYQKNARYALNHPDKHWWKSHPRHKIAIPIKLTIGSKEIEAQTFDLSKSGTFIAFDSINHQIKNHMDDTLIEGSVVTFIIGLDQYQKPITCHAQVVRKTREKGQYPAGVGLKFDKISYEINRFLNHRPAIEQRI